jgi:RNA polymerase sigma-70 factor, ECF subfamily
MESEFTDLLFEHQGIVHKICNLYFGNRMEKEDYQQELIIQLWKAFPSFSNQSKFSTWMYRVCLNAAIDIIRKEKILPKLVQLDEREAERMVDMGHETSPDQDKLYHAINQLTDIDKAIITLYLEEFSYKEIAEIMGITESNTGVKINRIKSLIIKTFENGNR